MPYSRLFAALNACLLIPTATLAADDVELLTDAEFLQPTSTLELRFSRPVITRDEVGTVPSRPPIEIQPALPGKFTWLSRQSGVFVPEAPPRLGTEFSVTVRPDFVAVDGQPIGQSFRGFVRTPPFGITSVQQNADDPDDVPPRPEVRLASNLELKIDPSLFRFSEDSGKSVDAVVRYATAEDYFNVPAENLDWLGRWERAKRGDPKPADEEGASEDNTTPLRDRLIVTPALPLQPGTGWRLEIAPGLSALAGEYRMAEGQTIALGRVQPFSISGLTATNYINSGCALVVRFSRQLAPDIVPENAGRFFRIEPSVEQLRFEPGWQDLTIRGNFQVAQEYRLSATPEVVDRDGLPLEGERSRPFRFEPVQPRLYLPTIVGDQFRGGKRKFEVLSVNVRQIRVKAAVVDPADTAAAMLAFSKYEREDLSDNPDEPYQPIPEDAIRARVIYDRTIPVPDQAVDAEQKTVLDWSEITGTDNGGNRFVGSGADKAAPSIAGPGFSGSIFLTVEGEPLPQAAQQRVGAQSLVQLTDIGVLWTREQDELRLSVLSLTSGSPLAGAQIRVLNEQLKQLSNQVSDSAGSASIQFTPEIQWLVVGYQNDAYVLRLGSAAKSLSAAGFSLPIWYPDWSSTADSERLRTFLFSDRPLYRPGETVHLKGLVRGIDRNGLTVSANQDGTVRLTDVRAETKFQTEVRTDTAGAFHADIPLEASANGRHLIRVEFDDRDDTTENATATCAFEVADFQPNAFELNLTLPEHLSPDTPVEGAVTANYFFGGPVTRSTLRWTLQYAPREFFPDGFDLFSFAGSQAKTTTLRGSGTYEKGRPFQIAPQLPAQEGPPYQGVLTVEMTDLNQQTVTESRVFRRDSSDFYLGILVNGGNRFVDSGADKAAPSIANSGASCPVRVIAVAPDGQPVQQSVEVEIELIRKRHDTVRVQGAGGAVSFRSETTEENLGTTPGKTVLPIRKGQRWEAPETETARLTIPAAGEYIVRAKAADSKNRRVVTEYSLYVSGDDAVAWDYRNAAQIDLVPDKPEYQPGETARLLVKSPFAGDALVTVARGSRILRSMRLALTGNTPTLQLPIETGDAPNIFVSAILIRGSEQSTRQTKTPEFRYGVAALPVIDPATRLQLSINPLKTTVEPGETVEAEIVVHDHRDQPVSDASVTFFAVDDGILALTGYERPNPHSTFHRPFPLNVQTGLTIDSLLPEDPQDLEFSNKGYLIGGGGLDLPGAKPRTDFPGTAFWVPALQTDHTGRARIKFAAPDALTRYRLVAVAYAKADQFGSAESSFNIRKPLMLLPSIGQLARVNDQLIARAVVRNETGADQNVEVQLQLDERAAADKQAAVSLAIPAGGTSTFDVPVSFKSPGTSRWQWSARADRYSDSVVSTIEVGPEGQTLQETYLTDLTEPLTNLATSINPQLREGQGTVEVTLSNTRLTSLRESVNQLRYYPYSCTEQTTSSLVPWVVRSELRSALPNLVADDVSSRAAIAHGVAELFSRQTTSGGLAMWPGNNTPALFVSAYAAWVLAFLQIQGTDLPDAAFDRLLDYLSAELRNLAGIKDEPRLSDRTFAAMALATAGRAEPGYNEELFNRRRELSRESRAALAFAVLAAESPRSMVDRLLDPKAAAPEGESIFGGGARTNALQLLVWSLHKPRTPEVGRLVKELLGSRRNGHWGTTQANAWSLIALARYYKAVESGGKTVAGTVVAGERSAQFLVSRDVPSWSKSFPLELGSPLADLVVQRQKSGVLFGDARFVVYPRVAQQPRQDRGYAVSRLYQKIADDGSIQPIDALKVGDRVLVTLQVQCNRPGRLVAIDDPVPAIFEAVNPNFQAQTPAEGANLARDGVADHREIRSDRVLFFCDQLAAGASTFRYLARVRMAGQASAPGTKVEEMYRPDRFGLAESERVTSEP